MLLGAAVTTGVFKGELDPNKVKEEETAKNKGEVKDLRVDDV